MDYFDVLTMPYRLAAGALERLVWFMRKLNRLRAGWASKLFRNDQSIYGLTEIDWISASRVGRDGLKFAGDVAFNLSATAWKYALKSSPVGFDL